MSQTSMRGPSPEASGEAIGPEGDDSNMGTVPTSGPEATSSQGIKLTPTRIAFLQYLAKHGETRWARMPATPNGRPVTNQTFRPLAAAGLIVAEFKQPEWRYPSDWYFAITDTGRAAIAKAVQP